MSLSRALRRSLDKNDLIMALSAETKPGYRAEILSIGAEHTAENGSLRIASVFLADAGSEYLELAIKIGDGDYGRYYKALGEVFIRNSQYIGTKITGRTAVELIKLLRERAAAPSDEEMRLAGVQADKLQFKSSIRHRFADVQASVNLALREIQREQSSDSK